MKEDQNIENFFRKRLETKEFSYQESDWEKLEQRLDAESPSDKVYVSRKKLLIAGAIAIVITFFTGWFLHDLYIKAPSPDPVLKTGPDQSQDEMPSVKGEADSRSGDRSLTFGKEKDSFSRSAGEQDGATVQLDESSVSRRDGSQLPKGAQAGPSSDTQYQTTGASESDELAFDQLEIGRKGFSGIPVAGPEYELLLADEPVIYHASELPEEPAEKQDDSRFLGRWWLGAVVAPDFNSIGMAGDRTMSALLGGQIYYEITPRWMISGGVLLNRKKYETSGENYSPPDGYWQGNVPESIDGSCKVLDIPVMITYQWTANSRFNVGSSVGISSYVLLDEIYKFDYDIPYYTGGYSGWETEENTLLMAGVINFSLIASMQITDRVSLSAEPYLKKPLRNVGWGKVDLISAGTLFTLRYRFFKP